MLLGDLQVELEVLDVREPHLLQASGAAAAAFFVAFFAMLDSFPKAVSRYANRVLR